MSAVASARMADQNDKVVPVRMKKKTLKKLTNAEKLEVENKKMEERLRSLRQTIEKEKSERSNKGENAPIWQSGQKGAVQNHAKEHMSKNKGKVERAMKGDKKIRVKFLTPDKPQPKVEPSPRAATPHNTHQQEGGTWAIQQTGQEEGRPSTPRTQRTEEPAEYNNLVHAVVPTCGQCEESAANLNCVECGEKYCEQCFASFHRKGALKTHRTRPLTRQSSNMLLRESTFVSNEPIIQEEQQASNNNNSNSNCSSKKPLEKTLWGEYNEDDSAQSFQAAVNQWRGGETATTTTGGQITHSQQADASQTAFTAIPEFSFKENENLSYFDRILLKKCKDLEYDQNYEQSSERDLPSRQYSTHTDSPGELTISQLDFFNEFRNIEQKEKAEELTRSSSVVIQEVTYNAGGLEEESNCVVEEDVKEPGEVHEKEAEQVQAPVTPRGHVTIEELITPAPAEQTTPVLRDAFYTPVTSPSTVGVFNTNSHVPLVSKKSMQSITSSLEPQPASPRCVTPPRDDRITVQSLSPEEELGQRYTDTPISPLKRRMPTNPSIERQHSQATYSSSGPQKHSFYNNRPATADVVILSSQAWKQSFFGFLNAGLPGYTLPQSPVQEATEHEQDVMLTGPPIWCPGESEASNEQFTPRENSIAFSLSEGLSGVKEELNSSTDTVDLELETKEEDCNEDEEALAALTLEHQASSLDLTEQLEEIREGTPNPLSLLTHDDRMAQLDMEARGISPTMTPILTKLTVRQSLFDDFEEMEKQCMAGDEEQLSG